MYKTKRTAETRCVSAVLRALLAIVPDNASIDFHLLGEEVNPIPIVTVDESVLFIEGGVTIWW